MKGTGVLPVLMRETPSATGWMPVPLTFGHSARAAVAKGTGKMPVAIIDDFAHSAKNQNVQLSIEGILPRFAAEYNVQGGRRGKGAPPRPSAAATLIRRGGAETSLPKLTIYGNYDAVFYDFTKAIEQRCILTADHRQKPSRTFGQMILKVWVNDPERLTKRSRRFFRKNESSSPKLRASKNGTIP
ncbi:MAG: hypothetical protein IIT98_04105 [Kiritimatiellae bacterium]|nr:hypothetical protein [Kiritimatiellia bacterium]